MTSSPPNTLNVRHGLLGLLAAILYKYLFGAILITILLAAAFYLWFRRRHSKSILDTESWMNDEKILVELKLPTSLPDLVSEYSPPLAHALFQQSGVPTSGDMIRTEQLTSSRVARSPSPISVPNSGDLAAMAGATAEETQRHPWRRHSYPDPWSSDGYLGPHQRDALITEDTIEFFRDDKAGKLWRRRTLEFGSTPAS